MSNPNSMPPDSSGDDKENGRGPGRPRNYTGFVVIGMIVVVVVIVLQSELHDTQEILFPEFMNHLIQGNVEKVKVEKSQLEVVLIKGASGGRTTCRVIVPDKFVSENALMLEEIAELGRNAEKANTGAFIDHLRAVVRQNAPRGFVVLKRFIIHGDQSAGQNGGDDMLLVQMTAPPNTESGGLSKRGDLRTYRLVPTRAAKDAAQADTRLSFEDLILATASNDENARAGLPAVGSVTRTLPLAKGSLRFSEENTTVETLLITLAPWVVLLIFLYFVFFRQLKSNGIGGNVLSFGRSRAKVANREKSAVTFADVAGIEEAKDEVGEIVEFLKHPTRFTRLGARIPRGLLLVGPPGTGKTLLAKAIAGEADVPFFSICGSDFVEMFVGVGASRVRDLFKQARENSPCIIFLDEIDAVGRRRGAGLGGGHDEREQTLNAILVEMDGFETDTGIIVIAATNRVDVLDPALLRPGRFDREIAVDLPDVKGRESILRVHGAKVKMHPSVDLERVARATPGFSGAELEAVVNEAAIIAVMRKKDFVFLEDLEEARDRVRWGRSKTSRMMDQADQKVTAYHEAGHTLISYLLTPRTHPPHKVTIVPRGRALGATMVLPEKDQYSFSKDQAEAHLQMCFGGRVAEELVFNQFTSGAADDIKKATDIARHMVREWGMSPELGPIHLADDDEPVFLGRDIGRRSQTSDATAEIVDREVRRIIDSGYEEAKKLIADNREKLDLLAENLVRYEILTREEIDGLMKGTSVETVRRRQSETQKSMDPTPKDTIVAPPVPTQNGTTPGLSSPGLAGGGALLRQGDEPGKAPADGASA